MIVGRTEFAHHFDLSIDHHFGAVLRREIIDHLLDTFGRTRAPIDQMLGFEHPYAGLVIEPEQHALRREIGVDQFRVRQRIEQGLGFGPVVVLDEIGVGMTCPP